jgi:hypothetical protein
MGQLFGFNVPKPPPPLPAANTPTLANPAVGLAGDALERKARAAAGAGFSDTVKNQGGVAGLTGKANTAPKTLLG